MELRLKSPLDMHLHLRDGAMLKTTLPASRHFAGALIMPNLVEPVDSEEKLVGYKKRILNGLNGEVFEPYMSLFLKPDYSEPFLEKMADQILAIKLYPEGVTTNSKGGVSSMEDARLETLFKIMEALQIPLAVHGETNGFVLDREAQFCHFYSKWAKDCPKLKIIMEHITTKEAAALLDRHENLFATITLHHLLITLDDLAGSKLKPHLFCKPIAKAEADRKALLELALNAHSKVMFGSDSAPHPREEKESSCCAAGIFTAPIALAQLAELFEKNGALQNLQAFVSDNAQRIYQISPPDKEIHLQNTPMIIPKIYGEVVPFRASEEISWSIVD